MKLYALKKELGLLNIFCVATGAMISSGLFILPGVAFGKAGPAVVISYIIAGILCIPTLLSNAELITAMPKAGGDYFYIMRGFGPLFGTVAGFSSWFSLSLKGAFALLGMGAYLSLIVRVPLNYIAVICGVGFIIINLMGVKEAGRLQVAVVTGLIVVLLYYIVRGAGAIAPSNYSPFFTKGFGAVFSTASFVFISYGGLTKVAALAEETKDPGRILPLGMILSILVTALLYVLVIFVTTGILEPEVFRNTLTPVSEGASALGDDVLKILVGIAALFAFVSTANSALMTASRYPLGMSRDRLFPFCFQRLSPKAKVPYPAILLTGSFMILSILFLKLELLVKVASSILILLYIFANLTVILFRESKILSYRPKFHAPFYPYLQITGILGGIFLLIEMGTVIIFFTMLFLFLGVIWYKVYAQKKVSRDSALIYLLERFVSKDVELTSDNLLVELKDIVVSRDSFIQDRFHRLIEESETLDIEGPINMEDFFKKVAEKLASMMNLESEKLYKKFIQREKHSSTVLREGLAVPHIIVEGKNIFKIFLARAKDGVIFPGNKLAHIIFILVGSSDERNLHLKVLAAIAQITQDPDFDRKWFEAINVYDLKNIVLFAERRRIV